MGIKNLRFKLPRIAPRQNEVEQIVALLESDEFDSATQMARKILALTFNLVAARDWFVVQTVLDGDGKTAPITYGMFATDNAAMKAVEQNTLGLFGKTRILEVKSLLDRMDYLNEVERAECDRLGCGLCRHSYEAHNWPRFPRDMCALCGCRTYTPVQPIPKEIEIT